MQKEDSSEEKIFWITEQENIRDSSDEANKNPFLYSMGL